MTFYLTREIIIVSFIILIVIFKCAQLALVTELVPSTFLNAPGPLICICESCQAATFGESLSKGKLSAALQNTKLNL